MVWKRPSIIYFCKLNLFQISLILLEVWIVYSNMAAAATLHLRTLRMINVICVQCKMLT